MVSEVIVTKAYGAGYPLGLPASSRAHLSASHIHSQQLPSDVHSPSLVPQSEEGLEGLVCFVPIFVV